MIAMDSSIPIREKPIRENTNTALAAFRSISKTGWLVFALYTISFIALTHDVEAFTTWHIRDYEANDGINEEEAFSKDVQAAPLPRRLGLLGLILVGVYCLFTAPSGVRVRNYWIGILAALLIGWAALSLSWSIESSETKRELIRISIYTAVAWALSRRFPTNEVCLMLVLGFLVSILLALTMDVAVGNFKPWQSLHRLQGSLHPNDIGRQALVVAIAAFAYMSRKSERTFWLILGSIAVVILVLTKSRTSFASLFAGLLTVSFIRVKGERFVSFVTAVLIVVSLAGLTWQLLGSEANSKISGGVSLGRTDKATSLTGRLPLWDQAFKQAEDNTMIGSGFGAFWTVERTKIMGEELEWFPRHAHSVYVEMIVNLGYVGLGILSTLVVILLVQSVALSRGTGRVEYTIFAAVVVAQLVYGITEASPILPRDQGLFNLVLMFSLMFSHESHEPMQEGFSQNDL